jgi:hydrogenase maturation protein HypF
VHRLALELGLSGRAQNEVGTVVLELQGSRSALEQLLERLPRELPLPGRLEPLQPHWLPAEGGTLGGPLAAAPGDAAGIQITASPAEPLGIGLVAPALSADLAPCRTCLAELADPANRRFGYAFMSCCACGPRYSIATAQPFARAHTSLAAFPPCAACLEEFHDPGNRRFHAETIGCPDCGPQLAWWGPSAQGGGEPAVEGGQGRAAGKAPSTDALIERACVLLAAGGILALQGVGGFQLLVDGTHAAAIERLRQRKRRPSKPLALLVADLAWITPSCMISAAEQAQLRHPAAPIVLLRRRLGGGDPLGARPSWEGSPAQQAPRFALSLEALEALAPGSADLGVMLPASPLHQLLAVRFGRPLVATSGNRSGEPLVSDPLVARRLLGEIADGFLVHNRPIARPLDDSLLQLIEGRPALLRRARGYAPEPLSLSVHLGNSAPHGPLLSPLEPTLGVLALGGDLKSAPALALGDQLFLAPQLGDLRAPACLQRLEVGAGELLSRHAHQIGAIAIDGHPGYLSHQLGHQLHQLGHRLSQGRVASLQAVPHHLAHGLAVAAEHGLDLPLLVLSFDGLGYGADDRPAAGLGGRSGQAGAGADGSGATVAPPLWGGELLLVEPGGWRRLAGLRPFPLPGGERAMAEPRRAALGLLATLGPVALAHPGARHSLAAFEPGEAALLLQAIAAGCNAPACSSVGRLFDAVASLLGLCQRLDHEGQGGQLLQGAAAPALAAREIGPGALAGYPLPLSHPPDGQAPPLGWLDWQPLLMALLDDLALPVDLALPDDLALADDLSLADGVAPTGVSHLGGHIGGHALGAHPAAIQRCAARFHLGLARAAAELAAGAAELSGCRQLALSGGCFQNRLLLEATIAALRQRCLSPFWGEAVPCNDGGLAVGQVWALRHGLTPQPGPDHPPGLARPPLPGPARREAEPCA